MSMFNTIPVRINDRLPQHAASHHANEWGKERHASTQEIRTQEVLQNLKRLFVNNQPIDGMTEAVFKREWNNKLKRVRVVRQTKTAVRSPIFLKAWGYWKNVKHVTRDAKGNRVVLKESMVRIPKAEAEYRAEHEGLNKRLNSDLYYSNMDYAVAELEHTRHLKEAGFESTFSVECCDSETETNPSSSDDFHELLDIAHQQTEMATDKRIASEMKWEYRLDAFQRVMDFIDGTDNPYDLKVLRKELRSAIIGHNEHPDEKKRRATRYNRSHRTWNEAREGYILRWYHGQPCPQGHELHFLNTIDPLGYGNPGTDDLVALHNECTSKLNCLFTAINPRHRPLTELRYSDEKFDVATEDVYHLNNASMLNYEAVTNNTSFGDDSQWDDELVEETHTNYIFDLLD